jgi:hypothetical protein
MVDRPKGNRSKSVGYFELLDAFRKEGCPVCRLLLKWSRSYLDSLFYEYVTDFGVRSRLRESDGFCNWHSWMAATIDHSQSGIAIIYEHLLKDQIERLQDALRFIKPRLWWGRLKARWFRVEGKPPIFAQRKQRSPCPACERLDQFLEPDLTDTLLSSLADPEFADSFHLSFGLCLPHLYNAMVTGRDHPNLPLLVELQLQKFETLRGELAEYIRKLDYRFMAEPRGEEKTSWRRVVELFVGKPEVFGRDRRAWDTTPSQQSVPAPASPGQCQEVESAKSGGEETEQFRKNLLPHPKMTREGC